MLAIDLTLSGTEAVIYHKNMIENPVCLPAPSWT